jgi:WD40 repeat protein/photosystem II stability/assembly factor-like uncharacterized protein
VRCVFTWSLLIFLLVGCASIKPTSIPSGPLPITPRSTSSRTSTSVPYPSPEAGSAGLASAYPLPATPQPIPTKTSAAPAGNPDFRTLAGMTDRVRSITFSSQQPWLAALTQDGQIWIWDYHSGRKVRSFPGVSSYRDETPIAFEPNSTSLVNGTDEGKVILFDATNGNILHQFQGPVNEYPASFSFSPDGKDLAAGFNQSIWIWELASGAHLETITPKIDPQQITSLAYAPDGHTLAIGTAIGALLIWDVPLHKITQTLVSARGIDSLAFLPDGSLLATAALGAPVELWNTQTWEKWAAIPEETPGGSDASLSLSPDGKLLAVSPDGNSLQIIDVPRLEILFSISMQSYVTALAFSPAGKTLAVGADDKTIQLWDLSTYPPSIGTGTPVPTVLPDPVHYIFPQPLQPGQPISMTNIQMVDAQSGWGFAVDGPYNNLRTRYHLLRTSDGGHTWQQLRLPDGTYYPFSFFALDKMHTWMVPAYQIQTDSNGVMIPFKTLQTFRTTDGGSTWQAGQPFSLARRGIGDAVPDYSAEMQFFDGLNGRMLINVNCQGRAGCGWQLYQTIDGGNHWERLNDSENPTGPLFVSVAFTDPLTAWGVSNLEGWTGPKPDWNSAISKSTDGGKSWEVVPLPAPTSFPEAFQRHGLDCDGQTVKAIPPKGLSVITACIVYDDKTDPRFTFFQLTPDNGRTWHTWLSNGSEDFLNARTGWRFSTIGAMQATHLLQTTDGGATWSEVNWFPWSGALDFITNQEGWAVASQASAHALLHTSDGGKTWVQIMPELSIR